MADNNYTLAELFGSVAQAIATRPQKSLQTTTSTTNTTPYALADMISARDTLGNATSKLNEALKPRETYLYSLGSALSALPQQQGPGSWLSAFGRGFGLGSTAKTNAAVDRAQKVYEAQMADLAQRLAYDKAMGEKQTQYQRQDIDYKDMPYGGIGGKNNQTTQQIPILTPEYWDQMISNFDERRPTEASYRNMSQIHRKLRNKYMIAGTPEENYARDQYAAAKGREFLPMARNTLKGAGQITDFEDQKYTAWLNDVDDPVKLKDTAVRIVQDVAFENNWTQEQLSEGLRLLGLQSAEKDLLEQQKQYEPERVKNETDDIKKQNKNVVSRYTGKTITRRPEDIAKKWGATIIE